MSFYFISSRKMSLKDLSLREETEFSKSYFSERNCITREEIHFLLRNFWGRIRFFYQGKKLRSYQGRNEVLHRKGLGGKMSALLFFSWKCLGKKPKIFP